jgi:Uma2 family endonuclease
MAMPAPRTEGEVPDRWTVEMLDALPDDGNRYEIIDGELFVTPSPAGIHQFVVLALATRLRAYMHSTPVGRVIISPSDVRRPDRERNRVQPDVFVIRLHAGKYPMDPFELSDVLLAVEVVSPSNPEYHYQTKRELYLGNGVPEYWIVDPYARTFARWRGAADPGELLAQQMEWQPAGVDGPLVIEIPGFFEDALS